MSNFPIKKSEATEQNVEPPVKVEINRKLLMSINYR
jgi:hypothetical protein